MMYYAHFNDLLLAFAMKLALVVKNEFIILPPRSNVILVINAIPMEENVFVGKSRRFEYRALRISSRYVFVS